MSLGARCIVLVLWLVASGLYGVVSRGCHFAGLDENFRGEGVLWAAGGCFRGLAGQARLARRRAAERCDSASRCLDGGDCCSACFGSGRATVDTDRSSAGGAVVAPRKESGLSTGRWELSALCGRRPFCRPSSRGRARRLSRLAGRRRRRARARPPVASSNCPPWSTRGTTPRSEVPRRSRWRPGTSSTSQSWGRHRRRRRRRSRLPTSCRRSIIAQWFWATRRTSIMRCGARLGARLPERTSFARGFPRATARISPRNCQGPRISSSGSRRGGCSRLRPSCWTSSRWRRWRCTRRRSRG